MDRRLRKMEYKGSKTTLNAYVARIRREQTFGKVTVTVSRSQLLWSIWSEAQFDEWEKCIPEVFLNEFPDLKQLHHMIQDFLSIVREKKKQGLIDWLTTYRNMPFPAIQTFMNHVEKDIEAITAACSLSFSNGITEGHVNRLKNIKRMMYGRASSQLLTLRVLLAL